MKPTQLFSDGGLVGRNPSLIGGTWAWVVADDNDVIASASGFVPTIKIPASTIFRVKTPSGVFADGYWNNRDEIPDKLPDRQEHYFETAEADIIEIPVEARVKPITNNQMEMIAAILVFEHTDADFVGTFNCDSEVTIGRLFKDFALRNLPGNVKRRAFAVIDKFKIGKKDCTVQPVLLQGHPTKAELMIGTGDKNLPVSRYNKLCDDLCRKEAKKHMVGRKKEENV